MRNGRSTLAGDLLHDVALEDVALFDVVELVDGHAALVVLRDLLDGVLEALQRADLALVDDDVVAQHAHLAVARDLAVLDIAARDGADGGDLVGLTDLDRKSVV